MTKKAAFYILETERSPKEQAIYTCRIIEKAFNNKHKIYVHTNTLEEAQNFDNQLWTFGDISFVPHEIFPPVIEPDVPVLIGHGDIPSEQNDILVNLTPELPKSYQQFNHIIEVIANDENLKTLARKRFKIYKEAGYTPNIFNV